MRNCPARSCNVGASRAVELSHAQLEKIGEMWADSALRCTYCGVVYTGQPPAVLSRGYYDDPMGKQGWTPIGATA